MKLLLDENIPHQLYRDFPSEHPAFSVTYMQWRGVSNGEFLKKMQENLFGGLVTWDRSIAFQQNFSKYPVTVFVFHTSGNDYEVLKPLVEKIIAVIEKGAGAGPIVIT